MNNQKLIKEAQEATLGFLYKNEILDQGGECSSWCGHGCSCDAVERKIKEHVATILTNALAKKDEEYEKQRKDLRQKLQVLKKKKLSAAPPEGYEGLDFNSGWGWYDVAIDNVLDLLTKETPNPTD